MAEEKNYLSEDAMGFGAAPKATGYLSEDDMGFKPKGEGFLGHAKNLGLSLAKGVIAVPEAAVGLADIATGGRAGKFLENEDGAFGFRPEQAKAFLSDQHADGYKAKQQEFQDADGVMAKTGVALSNPSLIANTVVESLPVMGAGGVAARGLMGIGARGVAASAGGVGPVMPGALARMAGADAAPLIAGAVGEGTMMAGGAAEQIRQQTEDGLLTPGQTGAAAATGVIGGAFGYGGAKIARKLGIGDVDTMLAQGATRAAGQASSKSIPRQVVEGAMSEGLLEELPQSVSEQLLQNFALGKPWDDGLDAAIVMGTLAGMGMGGPAAGVSGWSGRGEQQRITQEEIALKQAEIERHVATLAEHQQNAERARLNAQLQAEARMAGLAEEEQGQQDVPPGNPNDYRATPAWAKPPEDAAPDYTSADDEIFQSTGTPQRVDPVREAVRQAADAGGSLSAAAGVAMDSGAAPTFMPPEVAEQPQEPQPEPVVLQNRDRTSAASIAQMQEIAAAPDYMRAGPSREMATGAPVVFGDLPGSAVVGRQEIVVDGRGGRVQAQYAVVDAADVIASNNADGTTVAEYANGLPGKLRAVAGNGRTAGLQAAYQQGTANNYAQELLNDAGALGIDPQAVASMQRPVLVRVMGQSDVTADMGDRTNITSTQKLSPVEQAANDSRRFSVENLSFDEQGNPTAQSIGGFVSSMPVSERGDMLNPDGTPTRQAVDRLMSATFKQAYDSDELVQLHAQATDPDARSVLAAAAGASGVMAALRGTGDFDVRGAVTDAVKMAVNASRQGLKLSDVLQNADFDMNPEAYPVATFLAQNIRSPKAMAEGLRRWGQLALQNARTAEENQYQGGLLGPAPTLSRQEIFARIGDAYNPTEQAVAARAQPQAPVAEQASIDAVQPAVQPAAMPVPGNFNGTPSASMGARTDASAGPGFGPASLKDAFAYHARKKQEAQAQQKTPEEPAYAATTTNDGTQAAPAQSAQGQTQQSAQVDVGQTWAAMHTDERKAAAKDAGVPIVAAAANWDRLNPDLQAKLGQVIVNQGGDTSQAVAAPPPEIKLQKHQQREADAGGTGLAGELDPKAQQSLLAMRNNPNVPDVPVQRYANGNTSWSPKDVPGFVDIGKGFSLRGYTVDGTVRQDIKLPNGMVMSRELRPDGTLVGSMEGDYRQIVEGEGYAEAQKLVDDFYASRGAKPAQLPQSAQAAQFIAGDWVRIKGEDKKLHTVDQIGRDGWVYLKSGLSFPPEKAAEFLFKSKPAPSNATFGGTVSMPEDRSPSHSENIARWGKSGTAAPQIAAPDAAPTNDDSKLITPQQTAAIERVNAGKAQYINTRTGKPQELAEAQQQAIEQAHKVAASGRASVDSIFEMDGQVYLVAERNGKKKAALLPKEGVPKPAADILLGHGYAARRNTLITQQEHEARQTSDAKLKAEADKATAEQDTPKVYRVTENGSHHGEYYVQRNKEWYRDVNGKLYAVGNRKGDNALLGVLDGAQTSDKMEFVGNYTGPGYATDRAGVKQSEQGGQAFADGKPRTPPEGLSVNEMKRWLSGWDAANVSAATQQEDVQQAEAPALSTYTPAEIEAQQARQEQAAKTDAASKRAADSQTKADDDRKRIAAASVAAADSFELGQAPMDSLTGQQDVFADTPVQPAAEVAPQPPAAQSPKQAKAIERVNAGKAFFFSPGKAGEFIEKNDLAATHEVVQENRAFHVKAKAAQPVAANSEANQPAAPDTPAPTATGLAAEETVAAKSPAPAASGKTLARSLAEKQVGERIELSQEDKEVRLINSMANAQDAYITQDGEELHVAEVVANENLKKASTETIQSALQGRPAGSERAKRLQAELDSRGAAAAKPAPAKRKLPPKLAAKAAEVEAQRAAYFSPGNVVASYTGHDRVVAYTPADAQGNWSVTVQPVERQGDKWVDVPSSKPRTHSTQPDARAMRAGPVVAAKANQPATPADTAPTATDSGAKQAAAASTYINGDRAEYTGKTEEIHGGLFYEVVYVEGRKNGEKAVTARAPDGENPLQSSPEKAKRRVVVPQDPGGNYDRFIKIAADSVSQLRKMDVDRVLNETPENFRDWIANYIKQSRSDLTQEVDGVMQELSESSQANQPAAPDTPAPAATETVADKVPAKEDAEAKPAEYGAKNTLVSQSRADELRAKLREKAKNHLFGGLDTEMMAWGTELAVFHLEAGVRKFTDLVAVMASDLGTTPAKLKPYLRSWYNGARDMMEDHGLSIEGMDNPDTVRAELSKIGNDEQATANNKKADTKPTMSTAEGRRAIAQAVADHMTGGNKFATINDARKFIEGISDSRIPPGTKQAKLADETVEVGVVIAAREIVSSSRKAGRTDEQIFERLVSLYDSQPSLNVRDTDSIREQAYSTPAPLAFVASRLAKVSATDKVGEPTGGNGMLIMEVTQKNAAVNELNNDRAGNLRSSGFTVSQNNAATSPLATEKSLDALVMNPPFGNVKDDAGNTVKYTVSPDYTTSEIDHAIVFKSLEAMKDDGNAVLIIGGTLAESNEGRKEAYRGRAKRQFFFNLRQQYNVVDHFTVGGDLYKKQGTTYPVDVIVIRGRGKSTTGDMPAANLPPIIDTWAQLQEKLNGDSVSVGTRLSGSTGGNIGASGTGTQQPQVLEPAGASPQETGRGGQRAGTDGSVGANDSSRTDGSAPGRGSSGSNGATGKPGNKAQADRGGRSGRVPGAGDSQQQDGAGSTGERNASGLGNGAGGSADRTRLSDEDAGKLQVRYRNFSGNKSVNTLVATNHLTALDSAFENLRNRVGDIDDYVRNSLQYSPEGFKKAFSAEQVEALALAIDNIERGRGFIIGDQTGIGKGRVVAAMIRYAKLNGKTPVFVTQMPDLYGDMMRDLNDIGMTDFKPLMTNNNAEVPLDAEALEWFSEVQAVDTRVKELESAIEEILIADGAADASTKATKTSVNPEVVSLRDEIAELKSSKPKRRGKFLETPNIDRHESDLAEFVKQGGIGDYGAIFTTYNQMAALDSGKPRRDKSGQKVASAPPKFAYRHDFLKAMVNQNAMLILDESHNAGAAGDGKFPKVGDVVRQLVKNAGSVFYSSATFAKNPSVMDVYSKTDLGNAFKGTAELTEALKTVPQQQVASAMLVENGQYIRRERSFDGIEYKIETVESDTQAAEDVAMAMRLVVEFDEAKKAAIEEIKNELDSAGAMIAAVEGGGSSGSVESTNFTSVMHNVVNTFLLSLKADAAADTAIAAIKAGEKPVLTVANTMEMFIRDYAESAGLKAGDMLNATFGDVLMRYLEKTRKARITGPTGDTETVELSDSQLGPDGVAAYESAREFIASLNLEVPLSPIDHIKERIVAAGYTIGEVTGRQNVVEGGIIRPRNKAEMNTAGKKNTIAKFNGGQLDALIINRSGSTGLSMHASETFADQRRRVMIVAQAELDINNHMQMLGRTNRTGQVTSNGKSPAKNAIYGLPRYVQLTADVPIELRPAAVLAGKMASLNANTTAGRKSAVEDSSAPDFMNKYGDEVAALVVISDPDLNKRLGYPIRSDENGNPVTTNAISKVTGRVGLLPLIEQRAIYERITNEYKDLIAQLDALGKNDLEAKTYPLDAKTLESTEVIAGDGSGVFNAPAVAEKVDVKKLGKPYSSDKVRELVSEALNGLTPSQHRNKLIEDFRTEARAEVDAENLKLANSKTAGAAIAEKKSKLQAAFVRFNNVLPTLGSPYVIKTTGNGNIYGIPISIQRKKGSASVGAMSSWVVKFAVVDGSRVMTFPFSQLFTEDSGNLTDNSVVVAPATTMNIPNAERTGFEEVDVIDAFDRGQSDSREVRYVMTGNLLRAGGKFSGRIISYTTAEGSVRQGLLMPVTFDLKAAQAKMTPELKDPAQMLKFLDAGGQIVDRETGGKIIAIRKTNRYEITVAKTGKGKPIHQRGGLYMASSGSMMRGTVYPPNQEAELLPFLDKVVSTLNIGLTTTPSTKSLVPAAPDIRRSTTTQQALRTPAATIHTAITQAYGKLLGQLEAKGLVTLAQTQEQAIEAAAQARADKTGGDVAQIRRSLAAAMQGGTDLDVKRSANGAVQGFFDPQTGQSFLVADNLTAQAAPGVLMHEVGIHMAADKTLAPLFNRAAMLLKAQKANPFMQRVQAKMDAAGETSGEEVAAYMVEAYESDRTAAPASVGKWLSDLLASVKAWMHRKGIIGADSLTVADIAAVARANAKSLAQGQVGQQSNAEIRFSRTPQWQAPQERAEPAPATWQSPETGKWDEAAYNIQDRHIDTKRVQQAIEADNGPLSDDMNVRQREELFHGRSAKEIQDFKTQELNPMLEQLGKDGIELPAFEEYLHARHAPEANKVMAERNPNQAMINAGRAQAAQEISALSVKMAATTDKTQQRVLKKALDNAIEDLAHWSKVTPYTGSEESRLMLSGMSEAQAKTVMAGLAPAQKAAMQRNAALFDGIVAKNRATMVEYGLESQDTIDSWANLFKSYVPLMREEAGGVHSGLGTGEGFSIKGREVKSRTGSTRKVVDIVANLAMQREKSIVRGEKNRVTLTLLELAQANPNSDFWTIGAPDKTQQYDPTTKTVKWVTDPLYKSRENVVVAKRTKADGSIEEVAITFNKNDERAMRMAVALKNLDDASLNKVLQVLAPATRTLAALSTQYNPSWGLFNFARDTLGVMVSLGNTPMTGDNPQGESNRLRIYKDAWKALPALYRGARAERKGSEDSSEWGKLWADFQKVGGAVGFRDMLRTSNDRTEQLKVVTDPDAWMQTPWGKAITLGGAIKPLAGKVKRGAEALFNWISDFNLALENATRVSVYKAGLNQGLSKERAASVAKNITVNFNRRGAVGHQIGAAYAFFNASVQGTARMAEAMSEMRKPGDPSSIRLTAYGKNILQGSLAIGVLQAVALAAAGFGDDEPPEFVRDRNIVVPTGWTGAGPEKGYITIPLPLGYNIIPSFGRRLAEFAMSGGKDPFKHITGLMGLVFDGFNPIGSGSFTQMLAPTVLDPIIAARENKDSFGRPIARESLDANVPGHALSRSTATAISKWLSESLNSVSGGDKYTRGKFSPSPDQIDYLGAQYAGGVGREIMKVIQSTSGAMAGEDVPMYKVPLLGRLAGNVDGPSAQLNAYYRNQQEVDKAEKRIKGLREDHKMAEASAERQRIGPLLLAQSQAADRQIKTLRKTKATMMDKGADREQIKAIEERMTTVMQRFNQLAEKQAQQRKLVTA